MKKILIDTNVILRFLLKDVLSQYKQVEGLFKKAKLRQIKIIVSQVVIFETVFILKKYYNFPKAEIVDKIGLILASEYFQIDKKEVFFKAIYFYKELNVSFADCFLIALAELDKLEFFSFDRKLISFRENYG